MSIFSITLLGLARVSSKSLLLNPTHFQVFSDFRHENSITKKKKIGKEQPVFQPNFPSNMVKNLGNPKETKLCGKFAVYTHSRRNLLLCLAVQSDSEK